MYLQEQHIFLVCALRIKWLFTDFLSSTMYAFGGFRGSMMNSFLEYSLGKFFFSRLLVELFK